MPVSRLLVRPDSAPVPALAPADRIGLSVLATEAPAAPARPAAAEPGLGALAAPGATAIPPSAVAADQPSESGRMPIATVVGPLGPVHAARWNAQRTS